MERAIQNGKIGEIGEICILVHILKDQNVDRLLTFGANITARPHLVLALDAELRIRGWLRRGCGSASYMRHGIGVRTARMVQRVDSAGAPPPSGDSTMASCPRGRWGGILGFNTRKAAAVDMKRPQKRVRRGAAASSWRMGSCKQLGIAILVMLVMEGCLPMSEGMPDSGFFHHAQRRNSGVSLPALCVPAWVHAPTHATPI